MATVNIKFFRPHLITGITAVYGIDSISPETITSSATSQATTGAVPDDATLVRISVTGGDIWFTSGTTPVAVHGQGTMLLDGLTEIFKIEKTHKIAVID